MDRSEGEALLVAYRERVRVLAQKKRDRISHHEVKQLFEELCDLTLSLWGEGSSQMTAVRQVPLQSRDELERMKSTARSQRFVVEERDVARIHVPRFSNDNLLRRTLSELDERVQELLSDLRAR
ncbi:MAG: hypothetical protein DCF16_12980 [Alphaproteobacteria bacterium]|nr:MAG: hypothetical protein DCF16_12980 [Alphaproteobacteria bacterium]